MSSDPLYTPEEINAILQRAATLQARQAPEPAASGLTLAELRQAAAEAGIDPQYVEAAALGMGQAPAPGVPSGLLGAPLHLELERTLPGLIAPERMDEVTRAIRQAFRVPGHVQQAGRAWEWVHGAARGEQWQVTLVPQGDRTHVRVYGRHARQARMAFFPLLALAFILAINLPLALGSGPLLGSAIGLGIVALGYVLGRTAFGALFRQRERRVHRLLDQLGRLATPLPAAPASETNPLSQQEATPPAQSIAAPLDVPASEPEHAPRRTRSRA